MCISCAVNHRSVPLCPQVLKGCRSPGLQGCDWHFPLQPQAGKEHSGSASNKSISVSTWDCTIQLHQPHSNPPAAWPPSAFEKRLRLASTASGRPLPISFTTSAVLQTTQGHITLREYQKRLCRCPLPSLSPQCISVGVPCQVSQTEKERASDLPSLPTAPRAPITLPPPP